MREHIRGVRGVVDVHDLHAWTITSGVPVLSAHVVVDDQCLDEGRTGEVLDRLGECLGRTSTSSTARSSSNRSGTRRTSRRTMLEWSVVGPSEPSRAVRAFRRLGPGGRMSGTMAGVESPHWRTAAILLTALLVLVASGWALSWVGASRVPSQSGPEVGFARDMYVHHEQAVVMSFLVRNRTDDPVVNQLAMDVAQGQATQQGRMLAGSTRAVSGRRPATTPRWRG